MQCRMILNEVCGICIDRRCLHLSNVTESLPAKLRVLERQGLHLLENDDVGRRILTLVEAFDLVLLVDHLILILQLHKVPQPSIVISCASIRVHTNA